MSNSKHWFTTSFLQGRCRKTVLGVCGGVCLCLSVCLSDHLCGCRSVCLPPLYYHCRRHPAFLHCIFIVVVILPSSTVLSLSSSSCLPAPYYHCHHPAFLHCIIIVVVILPSSTSSSPFYFFLAKNLFTNSQDLLFPFFFLLSSVSCFFSSLFSCSLKSVSLVVVVVFPC